jgi:urease accessory protein
MEADTRQMRSDRPYVLSNLKEGKGVDEIVAFIEHAGMLGHR